MDQISPVSFDQVTSLLQYPEGLNWITVVPSLFEIGALSVGKGAAAPVASAIVEIDSTTQGFLPPVMTTTQKNAISSPATGLVVFDSTLGKLCVFSTTWQTVTSA